MKILQYLRLTAPVANPTPDRRQRHDWRAQPIVPRGTRMKLVEIEVSVDPPVVLTVLQSGSYGSSQEVSERGCPALFSALTAAPVSGARPDLRRGVARPPGGAGGRRLS